MTTVTGQLIARSWDAQDGTKRTVTEIKATDVAVVPKVSAQPRQSGQQSGGWGQPAPQPQGDPWANGQQQGGGGWMPAGVNNDEPPFAP